MRAFASSLRAWRHLERQEGVKKAHGLTFPLAVLEAIGRPFGLAVTAEENEPAGPAGYDAVFISVLDSRCMIEAGRVFAEWHLPLRRAARRPPGPLVWAGGQGLHNPLPFAPIADIIVVGDAEDPLPALLRLWDRHGGEHAAFLAAASTVHGVFVPSHHDPREATIVQSVADDVSITIREDVRVSHDGSRRVEIARGCRFKCGFCSLGWRAPLRENAAPAVIEALTATGGRRVHLQAGDAESHSGIGVIRSALREMGGQDLGWTGRLDTTMDAQYDEIAGSKRYAFGVEGVSHRLRRGVGKGYLTDETLIANTCRFFDAIEGDSKGRGAWHMIAGLPTQRAAEVLDLMRVIQSIDARRRGRTPRNLSIHWQPFQPLPGTPLQWCATGSGARRLAGYVRPIESQRWVPVRQFQGRTDDVAVICSCLARADERGADLIEAVAARSVSPAEAQRIAGVGAGALDPDAPLPWDFVQHAYPRDALRRAYAAAMRRFAGEER